MHAPVALLAPTVRMASSLARATHAEIPGAALRPFTLASFLREENPPRRVVLCPAGRSVPEDVAFLRGVAARLLWPAPPARVAEAIEGIRGHDEPPAARPAGGPSRADRGPSLLLEGRVDAARVRASLRDTRTRHWIVESAGHVRLGPRALERLEREGVRWSALAPLVVEGVWVTPRLRRVRRAWSGLLPRRAPVWTRS